MNQNELEELLSDAYGLANELLSIAQAIAENHPEYAEYADIVESVYDETQRLFDELPD